MYATKASLNYSFAFRMAGIRRIWDSLKKAVPGKEISIKVIWDSVHNSIQEEEINGKKAIVHRHTANKAYEGKPVIVSGYNTTCSYIAVGLSGTDSTLYSSDHGAGVTIKKMEKEGISKKHPKNYTTHIYQTRSPFKRIKHHITEEGIEFVLKKLEEEKVLKPAVRLRPLAVFKG